MFAIFDTFARRKWSWQRSPSTEKSQKHLLCQGDDDLFAKAPEIAVKPDQILASAIFFKYYVSATKDAARLSSPR